MTEPDARLPHPADLAGRRTLLLQGPMGPFFRRLREELSQRGVEVTKVNFNPGDDLFDQGPAVVHYRGTPEAWPSFLEQLLEERNIDSLFLFGDGRAYHRQAMRVAKARQIPVYVFEEGYLRPHFITLERGGVNGHSSMSRDPATYTRRSGPDRKRPSAEPGTPGSSFWHAAWYSTLYSMALSWRGGYPHYRHHRPLNALSEAFAWTRGGVRKLWYGVRERSVFEYLTSEASGRFFFVPLQVYCDYQLKHSRFESIEAFMAFVIEQFATHAPADTELVLKHHPLDRGYRDYGKAIARLGKLHGVAGRVHYVHDLQLPDLLRHARGCVTINSTVGLQAVHHRVPTKVLGTAVYDIEGMTSHQPLAAFMRDPAPVTTALYSAYRQYLLQHNQGRGSFYRRMPNVETPTGVLWPPRLLT